MSRDEKCPWCGLHPYEYADIGIGSQAIAVNCCDYGELYYTGEMTHAEIEELRRQWPPVDDAYVNATIRD